MLEAVGTHYTS